MNAKIALALIALGLGAAGTRAQNKVLPDEPAPVSSQQIQDERTAFNKRQSDERKAYKDSLKSKSASERRRLWKDFQRKQSDERKAFDKMQRQETRGNPAQNERLPGELK